MELFPVYSLFDIALVKGRGCTVIDTEGNEYLDLYGGHAVISVGHGHPEYVAALKDQLDQLAYYSNSVRLPIQEELAEQLGRLSGCGSYRLFLCNSGAEAIENALKLASFHNGRSKVIHFDSSFHGRSHGAAAVTDNPAIRSAINSAEHVVCLPLNDNVALERAFSDNSGDIAAVIIEPIQGVGGIREATPEFLRHIQTLCKADGACFICDEVQSGYGRSGKFFAFQHAGVRPDLITVAKGMGNGFPVGGVLIAPEIQARPGMLGTTFGGNPLACAASLAVLRIIEQENLIGAAADLGARFMSDLSGLPGVAEVRGKGLMIGLVLDRPAAPVRMELLRKHRIFTGNAKQPEVLRFLPPLTVDWDDLQGTTAALKAVLQQ